MVSYVALIRKEEGSDYGVEFPDLPGCVTAGVDLDDARRLAEETLALHLEGMAEDGAEIPRPRTFDAIMTEAANRDAVAVLVDARNAPSPVVRLNITLPTDLVKAIDAHAKNRSRFLADAARRALAVGN